MPGALGALPSPAKCESIVGGIQQLINGAIKKGAWDPAKLAGPPLLAVTGRSDTWTEVGLDALVPNWQIRTPQAIWRSLADRFEPDSYPFFQCPGAPGMPGGGPGAPPEDPGFLPAGIAGALPFIIGGGVLLLLASRR